MRFVRTALTWHTADCLMLAGLLAGRHGRQVRPSRVAEEIDVHPSQAPGVGACCYWRLERVQFGSDAADMRETR